MTDQAASFLEEYRAQALLTARLQAEADHAEELRKIAFAEAVTQQPNGLSMGKAEHVARTTEGFKAAVEALHAANLAAGEAKAHLDYLGKRWEKWRTQMASARVKQQIEGG